MAYWDRISATKTAPEASEIMMKLIRDGVGNAQNPHRKGSEALEILEESRHTIADFIHAQPCEIIFTSNGTESNNLGLVGMARGAGRARKARKILVSAVEHVSVIKTVQHLEREGFQLEIIPVNAEGLINRNVFEEALTDDVLMVSVQMVNPEVGTVQPIADLAGSAREKGILFHTDAIAAGGWLPLDVNALNVDALSIAGTMYHGPPGAAALYIRKKTAVVPVMFGGVQESSRRPGTENIPAIAGMARASELAGNQLDTRIHHARKLADELKNGLKGLQAVQLTGNWGNRLPGHVSLVVNYVEGEALLLMLNMKDIYASSGSSCTAKDLKISPVLTAMGLDQTVAQGSLVFSSVVDTTLADVQVVVEELPAIISKLRDMSPLWSRRQEGM